MHFRDYGRLIGLVLLLAVAGSATAFHRNGAARCNACHTLHNSEDGLPVTAAIATSNIAGLNAGSVAAVCLSCHAADAGAVWGTNILWPPPERGAGNFAFLSEDNLNDATNGATAPLSGACGGHSVVAMEMGLQPDARHFVAPGGNYPSSELTCTSCHDPHGNQNFRMLYGVGPVPSGSFQFSQPAPQAQGIGLSGAAESASQHTAYQAGMSAWCGNCHTAVHLTLATFLHPVDAPLSARTISRYNRYAGGTDTTGGTEATAYVPQVPFEDPANTNSGTTGPGSESRVFCLSCHRAHATSAPAGGRWDFRVVRLGDDGLISGSYPLPNPYNDPNQISLCAKCHSKADAHWPGQGCTSCHTNPHGQGRQCQTCHRIHGGAIPVSPSGFTTE